MTAISYIRDYPCDWPVILASDCTGDSSADLRSRSSAAHGFGMGRGRVMTPAGAAVGALDPNVGLGPNMGGAAIWPFSMTETCR